MQQMKMFMVTAAIRLGTVTLILLLIGFFSVTRQTVVYRDNFAIEVFFYVSIFEESIEVDVYFRTRICGSGVDKSVSCHDLIDKNSIFPAGISSIWEEKKSVKPVNSRVIGLKRNFEWKLTYNMRWCRLSSVTFINAKCSCMKLRIWN